MLCLTFPFIRPRHATVVAASLSLLSVAACGEAGTAPPAASPPAASRAEQANPHASLQIDLNPALSVRIVDKDGKSVGGAQVTFTGYRGQQKAVNDNHAGDSDSRLGYIRTQMLPAASYRACLTGALSAYGADPGTCNTRSGGSLAVDMGQLLIHKRPLLSFNMRNQSGAFVPGAAVSVTGPNGFSKTLADGGIGDQGSGNNGVIALTLPLPGTYSWCEIVAPTNYLLTNPSCGTLDAKWDIIHVLLLQHAPVISTDPW
jgi:hypothetical protein